MSPRVRQVALTAHVTASVGWLGAVAAFLALAVAGVASGDEQRVRGAYVAMELTGWYVIVPLSLASLLTGLVQSLGTTWGLVRHYWVLVKLLITVAATFLLLLHMAPCRTWPAPRRPPRCRTATSGRCGPSSSRTPARRSSCCSSPPRCPWSSRAG